MHCWPAMDAAHTWAAHWRFVSAHPGPSPTSPPRSLQASAPHLPQQLTGPCAKQVWADLYGLPVPGCEGKTAFQIFEAAGCVAPAPPSCAACLGGPKDTFARMNEAETVVSTTNRCSLVQGLGSGLLWGFGLWHLVLVARRTPLRASSRLRRASATRCSLG